MVFGTLAACAHGSALPLMILVFGNMTDLFIKNYVSNNATITINATNTTGQNENLVKEMGKYAIYYTSKNED